MSNGNVTRYVTDPVTAPRPDPTRPLFNASHLDNLKVGARTSAYLPSHAEVVTMRCL